MLKLQPKTGLSELEILAFFQKNRAPFSQGVFNFQYRSNRRFKVIGGITTWAIFGYLFISFISQQAFAQTLKFSDLPPPPIQRIIALSPHLTEMVFSAGAGQNLIGVVAYSDYPKSAQALPQVGSYNAINYEKILALKPDLILAWQGGNRPQDIQRLKQLGFKLFLSHPQKLSDIPDEIEAIGQLAGTSRTAHQTAERLRRQLRQVQQAYQHKPWVRTFYQVWYPPLFTISGQSFISQALNLCHASNLFKDLPSVAGQVSIESVLTRQPQLILLGGTAKKQTEWKKFWQRYPMIEAVKRHHIYPVPADAIQRPTARLIQTLPQLCQLITQARSSN